MEEKSKRDNYRETLILLIIGSALLIFTSVYFIQIFSTQYGIGAGAIVQSSADNTTVSQSLQFLSSQLSVINQYVLESYLGLVLALLLSLLAVVIYTMKTNRYDDGNRRYLSMHTTVTVVYIILFAIIYSGFIHTTLSIMVYLGFFGMLICLITDVYLEYDMRVASARKVGVRNITIDPDTPYTNIQTLRSKLFSNLKGNIRIVDKHFNSDAIGNLHRLIAGDLKGVDSISVITSSSMIDSSFAGDYRDLTRELKNHEVTFEVKVMKEEDASTQHERFVFDDVSAFKIPPMNIIHKKSEHITKINLSEARKRFDYLSLSATKIDNFLVRQGKE